jgi:putative phosphoribosyl transferase
MFANRSAAGVELAHSVMSRSLEGPVCVLALPRGGVPVAYEVADALRVPLDVMVVRKIGAPRQRELAIGAIATGGIIIRDPHAESAFPGSPGQFERLVRHEQAELARRERVYRGGLPPLDLRNSTVILVDDGIATGCTMVAAARAARHAGARAIVIAVPVASEDGLALAVAEADESIVLNIPQHLVAIGEYYKDFDQVTDAEVLRLLERSRSHPVRK